MHKLLLYRYVFSFFPLHYFAIVLCFVLRDSRVFTACTFPPPNSLLFCFYFLINILRYCLCLYEYCFRPLPITTPRRYTAAVRPFRATVRKTNRCNDRVYSAETQYSVYSPQNVMHKTWLAVSEITVVGNRNRKKKKAHDELADVSRCSVCARRVFVSVHISTVFVLILALGPAHDAKTLIEISRYCSWTNNLPFDALNINC